jgi:hypothetical protein
VHVVLVLTVMAVIVLSTAPEGGLRVGDRNWHGPLTGGVPVLVVSDDSEHATL